MYFCGEVLTLVTFVATFWNRYQLGKKNYSAPLKCLAHIHISSVWGKAFMKCVVTCQSDAHHIPWRNWQITDLSA